MQGTQTMITAHEALLSKLPQNMRDELLFKLFAKLAVSAEPYKSKFNALRAIYMRHFHLGRDLAAVTALYEMVTKEEIRQELEIKPLRTPRRAKVNSYKRSRKRGAWKKGNSGGRLNQTKCA